MSMKWPQPGAGNAAAYGVSGIPFATGSLIVADITTQRIDFDYVTRFFVVVNEGANAMRVGFTANGVSGSGGTNFFTVAGNTNTERLEIRCRELFLRGESGPITASVVAGLTAVPRSNYFSVTGSQFVSGAAFLPNGVG